MANAIIDTLKTRDESGEEHLLYPRSKTTAIVNNEGENLDDIINRINIRVSDSTFNDVYAETSINMGRKKDSVVGKNSIAVGYNCEASGEYSYANGFDCAATGNYSHAEGNYNKATGTYAHVEGTGCTASEVGGHAEGGYNYAIGKYSHAENSNNRAEGESSHVEGYNTRTTSTGIYAHAEGYNSQAQEHSSHAEGFDTRASGEHSHSEGLYSEAGGEASHAEGKSTKATGFASHAEGTGSKATEDSSHAEGWYTEANDTNAHSEGYYSKANGNTSHAEGYYTEANDSYTHVEGYYTKASSPYQHVQGKYNIEDKESKYAHIVGGGESNSNRKNIHTIDWQGNAVFGGSITDGGGTTMKGIETTTEGVINSCVESNVKINSIVGTFEQIKTNGNQLYVFTDRTVEQNGITITFKDTVGIATGTPTITSGVLFDVYFEPMTNLVEGVTYRAENYCMLSVLFKNGTTEIRTWQGITYDSSTVESITPLVRVVDYNYKDGMVIKPMVVIQGSSTSHEPYTGGIPSPSPLYPQDLKYSLFSKVSISTDLESCEAVADNPIMLCRMKDVYDEIKTNKLIKRFDKIILDGDENIVLDDITKCFIITPSILAKTGTENIASDKYKYFKTNTYDTNYGLFVLDGGKIGIKHDDFTTVDEYKAWLADNNVTIIYEIEEEEIIPLDSEFVNGLNSLNTFVGENTITTDSSTIHPIIEFEYATSKMAVCVMKMWESFESSGFNSSELSSILTTETF